MLEGWLAIVLLYGAIGVLVGVLSGLLGVGGGIVLVPILSTLFVAKGWSSELAYHAALGTSMACIVFTSISSAVAHHRKHNIRWPYVRIMAPVAFLASMLATYWVIQLNAAYLALCFAGFTLYAAMQLASDRKPVGTTHPSPTEMRVVAFVVGVISAVVSIGGGTLTVPYLTLRHVDVKQAIGTSAALGLPIALASSASYVYDALHSAQLLPDSFGYLYLPAIILITPISVICAPLGVQLTKRLPVRAIKRIFAAFLLLVTIKIVWTHWM